MDNTLFTNYSEVTFLDKIKQSLRDCESFNFSVSFIKKAGLQLLVKYIEEALIRGAVGRIITSSYQNFTDIGALLVFVDLMNKYPNFICHLDYECFGDNGFHSKGYLFQYKDGYEIIIGSSNITRFALLKNIEWDLSIQSNEEIASYWEAMDEFGDLWERTLELNIELIDKYRKHLDYAIDKWDMDYYDPDTDEFNPNTMQRKALKEIRRYRDMGVNRALVVSATGSGKTFLAAFDARNFDAKKLLYIVHKDIILNAAKETFKAVFRTKRSYGFYTGAEQNIDSDFLFATNTMMSNHLNEFDSHEFDYIVIDEAHHAAADTYRSIMEHFKPSFILGLTATPERMDNKDVFDLFEQNVPYELRLKEAIENDLIVPFHYYGIRDEQLNYSTKQQLDAIIKEISSSDNVEFIAKEIEKHRMPGKLRILAFCASIAHAISMSEAFNEYGYNATALTGTSNLGERIKAFTEVQDATNKLEIICCVDILNEGIDIPSINMVLFLRPTESSTIFIQQLGRGLRKYEGKEYVTILDFIGNDYERSVQIAFALSSLGKTTAIEKQYIKALVTANFKSIDIPGVEVTIDELSKKEIIKYIDNVNFNQKVFLKKDYENFKLYLKAENYPTHMDYLNNDCAPDLLRLMKCKFGGKKNYSYYSFLKAIEEKNIPSFTDDAMNIINQISDLLPLVRKEEYLIIRELLRGLNDFSVLIDNKITQETISSAIKQLIKNSIVITHGDTYQLNVQKMNKQLLDYLQDLIEYGLKRFDQEFGDFKGLFKPLRNYYKEQILLLKEGNAYSFMLGTKFYPDGETYFFVGLNKTGDKKTDFDYKDEFKSGTIFQWESVKNTTFTKGDGPKLQNTKIVYLFIRKKDSEDSITLPFTYFGTGKLTNPRSNYVMVQDKDGNNSKHDTIMYDVLLDQPVPHEYYFDFEIPEDKVEKD